jgi:hypothetical protein
MILLRHTTTGPAIWDRNEFLCISAFLPTETDIIEKQAHLGYAVGGYDFPRNIQIERRPDGWLVSWECAGSCD